MIGNFFLCLFVGTGAIAWLVLAVGFTLLVRQAIIMSRHDRTNRQQARDGITEIEALLKTEAER